MQNSKMTPMKVNGEVVGVASADFTKEGAAIVMMINHTDAGRQVWEMLSDPEYGYSFHDDQEDGDDLTFEQGLSQLINRHSMESESGTPDFVLAGYLAACLENFKVAVTQRAGFRGEHVEFKLESQIKGPHFSMLIMDETTPKED